MGSPSYTTRSADSVSEQIWSLVDTPYDQSCVHSIRGFAQSLLESKSAAQCQNDDSDPEAMMIELVDTDFQNSEDFAPWDWPASKPNYYFDRVVFLSPHPIHPIVQACKEARYFALKKFNLTFAFETYINFEIDTIYLDRSPGITFSEYGGIGSLSAEELLKNDTVKSAVKSLALSSGFSEIFAPQLSTRQNGYDGPNPAITIANIFEPKLPNLEELVLVHEDERYVSRNCGNARAPQDLVFIDVRTDGAEWEDWRKLWCEVERSHGGDGRPLAIRNVHARDGEWLSRWGQDAHVYPDLYPYRDV